MLDFPEPIVEFGALQVSQDSDLRDIFPGRQFIGTDFREGPGVDRVEDLRDLTFETDEIGTAICLDTLEHCEDPVAACQELARVTRPGGLAIISSVMLFCIHEFPNDYFRFTPQGFESLLKGFDASWVGSVGDPEIPFIVVGVAANGRGLDLSDGIPSMNWSQALWEQAPGALRVGPFRFQPRKLIKIVAKDLGRLGLERIRRSAPSSARFWGRSGG